MRVKRKRERKGKEGKEGTHLAVADDSHGDLVGAALESQRRDGHGGGKVRPHGRQTALGSVEGDQCKCASDKSGWG